MATRPEPREAFDVGRATALSDDGPPRRRTVVLALARPLLTAAALIVTYYVLPVDRRLHGWGLAMLVGELCLVVAVIVWQIRLILRARYPTLQGVEALALIVPLYLLVFANVYYLLAREQPGTFTEPLTRTDALYFTVTIFTTVGFGDIAPVTQTARALVTGQMAGNLLVLGVALRVIMTAVARGRRRKATADLEERPPAGQGGGHRAMPRAGSSQET